MQMRRCQVLPGYLHSSVGTYVHVLVVNIGTISMIVTLQTCASTAKVYASHSVTAMLEIIAIHELSKTMYNMGSMSMYLLPIVFLIGRQA